MASSAESVSVRYTSMEITVGGVGEPLGVGCVGESVMQPSEDIRKGYATNHIRAACVKDKLSLSVNGQELFSVLDDEYSIGGVGLIAGSFEIPGVEIYFDNFLVKKP